MASPAPAFGGRAMARPGARRQPGVVASALFALTKPRIIELLLVTTVPAMLLAQRGLPPAKLVGLTLLGGALAAGSANAFNCVIDRDIDAIMRRTSRRPLAAKGAASVIRPAEALAFAVMLGAASTVILGAGVNWLAAALADGAIGFYVFVYTLGLKRRTASNIVIGGAAGGFPVLVGWAAVTGSVGVPALLLFAVVFCWTPPHFWALAMRFRDDYARASVPMLPVLVPAATVARKILVYSYAMTAVSLALAGYAGWLYGACAAALGAWFLAGAYRLRGRVTAGGPAAPMRLFHQSITYLTLLFAVVAVTALLPWGHGHSQGLTPTAAPPRAAANFTLPALGHPGANVTLSQYAGRPVMVNFFSSTCAPCRQEAPLLAQFYRSHRGRVAVIGVDVTDSAGAALQFVRHAGIGYPVGSDPVATTAGAYGVVATPQTFFLDSAHRVVTRVFGPLTPHDLSAGLSEMRGGARRGAPGLPGDSDALSARHARGTDSRLSPGILVSRSGTTPWS